MSDSTSETLGSTTIEGVFIVVQRAIYRHKIMGCYTDIDRAKNAIDKYINIDARSDSKDNWLVDADGHHDYEVLYLPFNRAITQDSDAEYIAQYHSTDRINDLDNYRGIYRYEWAMG